MTWYLLGMLWIALGLVAAVMFGRIVKNGKLRRR